MVIVIVSRDHASSVATKWGNYLEDISEDENRNGKESNEVKNRNEIDQSKSNQNTLELTSIYNKIAPYLQDPEYIKEFLKQHTNSSRKRIIEIIETKIKSVNNR